MAGKLELVNKTIISATTSSFDVDNVFTSAYDIYMVKTQNMVADSTGTASTIRAITGGSADSSANYDYAALEMKESTAFVEQRQTNQTSISYLVMNAYNSTTDNVGGNVFYVLNPADTGKYTFFIGHMTAGVSSLVRGYKSVAVYTQTNQVTGLQINTFYSINAAEVTVYGVKG